MPMRLFARSTYLAVFALIALSTFQNTNAQGNERDAIVYELSELSEEVFLQEDRVFIVDKDYYLNGEIEIPADYMLEFRGGSIRNGILKCNNTLFTGKVRLINTTIKGAIENNRIEGDWFGLVEGNKIGVDNCMQFSHLVASCEYTKKDLHISSGIFRTSKPVVFNVDYSVYMDGVIMYTGTPDASAIYIGSEEGRKSGKVFYLSVSQSDYPSFRVDKDNFITLAPRNVGIEVSSVFSCEFHINRVEDFIYGLVLTDNRGLGCGDNEFHIGEIRNAYNGIRIVVGNDNHNQICWANDNKFIGGRIWAYKKTGLKRTAIKFERTNEKGMSDNAVFFAMDLENHYNAIDLGDFATGCILLGCRFENNDNPIANEGTKGNLIIGGQKYVTQTNFGPRTFFEYASELWRYKIKDVILDIPQIKFAFDGNNVSTLNLRISERINYSEVGEHELPSGIRDDGGLNINNSRFFVDIDVTKVRMLRIETAGMWRPMMDFYDVKGNKLCPFASYREHLYFYDSNVDGWYNREEAFVVAYKMKPEKPLELFVKDSNIKKIRLYIWGDVTFGECWIKSLKITADEFAQVDNENKLFHLSSRPIIVKGVDVVPKDMSIGIKPGVAYFDSSNKPIFWNGKEWVDAMGNAAE